MGLFFLCFCIQFLVFFNRLASGIYGFGLGNQTILSIPLVYDPGFRGKAFLLQAGEREPSFKAAISVEAIDGKFLCSLGVFFGEFQVWSSAHFSRFFLSGSCLLELMEDGVLQLKDTIGSIGWETRTSGLGVQKLELLRTGNLVLTDSNDQAKWQSFDFPADTMLWSQRLHVPARLTSFLSNSTTFSLEIQHNRIALYLTYSNYDYSYWDFKPNKNQTIAFAKVGVAGLKLFGSNSRKIGQILSSTPDPIQFLSLGKSGNLGFYHYSPVKRKFMASLYAVNSSCDLPLPCGLYGICTFSQSCTCMDFPRQQYQANSSCNEGFSDNFCSGHEAKMVEFKEVTTVLRSTNQRVNISKKECARWCTEDCSCAAVLFSDGRANGGQKECFRYGLAGGVKRVRRELGLNYMVKIPFGSGSHGSSFSIRKWILLLGGVVDILAVIAILGGLICYVVKKRRKALEGENS